MKFITPLLFLLFSQTSQAQVKTIQINTFKIPKHVIDKDRGLFTEVVKTAFARAGIEVIFKFKPPRRSKSDFVKGMADGYSPAIKKSLPPNSLLSSPYYNKVGLIYTRKGEHISGISQLTGKTVVLRMGFTYSDEITQAKGVTYQMGSSTATNLKMVSIGRVDGAIEDIAASNKAIASDKSLSNIVTDNIPIMSLPVGVAFSNSQKGHYLREKFNSELAKMHKDGVLLKLFAKYKLNKVLHLPNAK